VSAPDRRAIGYAAGHRAFGAYRSSQHTAQFEPAEEIAPLDAARLFWPPVDEGETAMQIARPVDAERLGFVDGWNAAKAAAATGKMTDADVGALAAEVAEGGPRAQSQGGDE